MPLTQIKYNNQIISSTIEFYPVNVTYANKQLVSIAPNTSKILKCSKKMLDTDIIIGSKILKTANKFASDDIEISVAAIQVVDLPVISGTYTYSGATITPTISYDSTKILITGGTSGIAAQTYTIICSIKDKTSYSWSDGTSTDKAITWTINKKSLTIPTIKGSYTFTGDSQNVQYNNFDGNTMTASGNTSATNAGSYSVNITLKDSSNYQWNDNTITAKTLSWTIAKKQITIPSVSGSITYDTAQHTPTITSMDDNYVNKSGDLTATNAGTYTVIFTLKDTANTMWTDSSTGQKTGTWYINAKVLTIPSVTGTVAYDGEEHEPTLKSFNANWMTKGGTTKASDYGTYTITFSLKDIANTKWSNGTTDTQTANWTIGKRTVTIPKVSGSFTYDKTGHSASIADVESDWVTQTGTISATNAGTYTVTFALKDPTNTTWTDGTTANISKTWNIAVRSLTIPTASGSFTYDGASHTATVNNYDSNYESQSGATQINAGSYTITWDLLDKINTKWSDGTTTTKTANWSIAVRSVNIPTLSGSFTYDGTEHQANISGVETSWVDQLASSVTKATNGGTYTVTWQLKDSVNTKWSNSTTANISKTWTIARAQVAVPAQSGSLTYSGGTQTPNWNSSYVSSYMSISGNSATNAGTYTATFTITDTNHTFSGGLTATASWTIGKATPSFTVTPSSATWSEPGTKTFTISNPSGLTFATPISDNEHFIVSMSGTTVTIIAQDQTYREIFGIITLASNETTNYFSAIRNINCTLEAMEITTTIVKVIGQGKSVEEPILPAGYTQVEYIEAYGGKYINTGYTHGANTEYEFKAKIRSTSNYGDIVGARTGYQNADEFTILQDNDKLSCNVNGAGKIYIIDPANTSTIYEGNVSVTEAIINNIRVETKKSTVNNCTYEDYLFGCNEKGSYSGDNQGSIIYYLNIKEGNTYKRKFIPCKNPSGTLGMYDLVYNTFYAMQGNGTAVAGPNVTIGEGQVSYVTINGEDITSPGEFEVNIGDVITCHVSGQDSQYFGYIYHNGIAVSSKSTGNEVTYNYTVTEPTELFLCYENSTPAGQIMLCEVSGAGNTNSEVTIDQYNGSTLWYGVDSDGKIWVCGTGGSGSRVPSGYTEIEYLTAYNGKYIDTGYTHGVNTVYEFKMKPRATSNFGDVIGARTGYQNKDEFVVLQNGANLSCNINGNSSKTIISSINTNTIYEGSVSVTEAIINNTRVSTEATTLANCTYTDYIFGCNEKGSYSGDNQGAIIYYLNIKENNNYKHQFIPCKNPSGTLGMYDLISGAFYPLQGSGSSQAGPDVGGGQSHIDQLTYTPHVIDNYTDGRHTLTLSTSWDETTHNYNFTYSNGEVIEVKLTLIAETGGSVSGGGYYAPGTSVTINATPLSGYRFNKWSNNITTASYTFVIEEDTTLTATFIRQYTITVQANTGGYAGGGGTVDAGNSVTLTASPQTNYTFSKWIDSSGQQVSTSNPWTFTPNKDETYTANFTYYNPCVTRDTLITLADGTKKRIDELTYKDTLLTYNLDSGVFEPSEISKIYFHGNDNYRIIKLIFDNAEVKVINEHGFLNCTKCEYSQINLFNYEQYIGDDFLLEDGTKTKLINIEIVEEESGSWSLITKNNENFFTNGLISLTGNRYNIFPINKDMIYDVQAKQELINTYGTFQYEEFSDRISREDFYELNCQYYKIPYELHIIDDEYIDREIPMLIEYHVIPNDN